MGPIDRLPTSAVEASKVCGIYRSCLSKAEKWIVSYVDRKGDVAFKVGPTYASAVQWAKSLGMLYRLDDDDDFVLPL